MTTPRISAVDLARALGQEHPPTPEQQAIIEEGLDEIEEELEGELMTAEKGRVAVLSAIQDMRSEIAALRAAVESQKK